MKSAAAVRQLNPSWGAGGTIAAGRNGSGNAACYGAAETAFAFANADILAAHALPVFEDVLAASGFANCAWCCYQNGARPAGTFD